ncbi:MAG TPA: polymer-forming cytoskeletal protein [Thermoanaerobaculia bacterium]
MSCDARLAGRRAILAFLLLLASGFALPANAAENSISIPKGTIRAGDIVVLGREIFLEGELSGSAVLVGGGTAVVSGRIRHDLILLGSSATLLRGAAIDGDVLAIGGSLTFEEDPPAASSFSSTSSRPESARRHPQVRGRIRTISALEAAALSELETSPLTAGKSSPLVFSFRLFLLFTWLVVSFGLLFLAPRRLLRAADDAPGRLAFLAALGATAVLTAFFLAAFALSVLPARPALAVGAALLAVLAAAKIFGLAVVFVVLGRRITRGVPRGRLLFGDPSALAAGLLVLGLLSLLPAFGPLLWGLSSLAGIGAALAAARDREPRLVLAAS